MVSQCQASSTNAQPVSAQDAARWMRSRATLPQRLLLGMALAATCLLSARASAQDRMYWADSEAGEVWSAHTDGGGAQALPIALIEPIDVAVDGCAAKIYVIDAGNNTILWADLDGMNSSVRVSGVGNGATRLAIDHAGNGLYWTDNHPTTPNLAKVYRANLDGSSAAPLVTGLNQAAGIALDIAAGRIFVSEMAAKRIRRFDLTGAALTDLVSGPSVGTPSTIALDVGGGRVYWADNAGFIRSTDFAGLAPQSITLGTPNSSLALDLENDKAYYSHDAANTSLRRRNMNGTPPIEILYPTAGSGAGGLENIEGLNLLVAAPSGRAYCTPGTSTNGCVAMISASGGPSASATSGFTLTASNVEGQKNGLFFYGVNGPIVSPWGASSSYLCVAAPTQRTVGLSSGGTLGACNGNLSVDFLSFVAANPGAVGVPLSSGQIVRAQAWYRDPPSPKTTSLSNAIVWTMCP